MNRQGGAGMAGMGGMGGMGTMGGMGGMGGTMSQYWKRHIAGKFLFLLSGYFKTDNSLDSFWLRIAIDFLAVLAILFQCKFKKRHCIVFNSIDITARSCNPWVRTRGAGLLECCFAVLSDRVQCCKWHRNDKITHWLHRFVILQYMRHLWC